MRAAGAAGIAEEHQEQAVRRKRRAFVMKTLGDDALARAVRLHHADAELAALLAGEGDEIALGRPDRRRIAPVAEGNALGLAAAGGHHVELLLAAAIALEHDLA